MVFHLPLEGRSKNPILWIFRVGGSASHPPNEYDWIAASPTQKIKGNFLTSPQGGGGEMEITPTIPAPAAPSCCRQSGCHARGLSPKAMVRRDRRIQRLVRSALRGPWRVMSPPCSPP